MGTACKNSQTACRTQDQKLLILHPVGYELPVPADAEQIVPRGFFQNGGGYPAEHINIRKNFFLFPVSYTHLDVYKRQAQLCTPD